MAQLTSGILFSGARGLTQIRLDFQITLLFESGMVISLGTVFSFRADGGRMSIIDPEGDRAQIVPVLYLQAQTLSSVKVSDGHLVIEFTNGSMILSAPHPDYEAWEYFAPEQDPERVISLPGGELAIWAKQ